MNKFNKLTPKQKHLEELTLKLIMYLQKHRMFHNINIYVNNQRFSSDFHVGDTEKNTSYGNFYLADDIDVTQIVEYNNPDTLTMTFEGPLYDELNYNRSNTRRDLEQIFAQYGFYFEQGYAWSLAAYYC